MPPHDADSPEAPALAYENREFLDSPDGRILRILAEYQEPMARFRRERIEDTVVFFGSARLRPRDVASAALEHLECTRSTTPVAQDEQSATPDGIEAIDAIKDRREFAVIAVEMAAYYEDARRLAGMLALWAKSLPGPRHRFVVTSGGGPGIMEAANRGAFEAGCKTIGLNIRLPFEQHSNPYLTPELNFEFHYFFMRKFWFAYLAKALVIFPGGFGTLDEMFELLTLAQTEKLATPITVIIYGSRYWKSILNLEAMARYGTIARKNIDLLRFADTPEEAFEILKSELILHHLSAEKEFGARGTGTVPEGPAPSAQQILGPDIARTRV
jgi:uncharacterized protein (TIGR00730 family)